MSERELLAELVAYNRKKHVLSIILSIAGIIAAGAVIASLYILLPRLLQSMEEISLITLQGAEQLKEIEKIDFDTLNQGISDFARIAKTLSSWFGG